jgi:hypothetical protein
MGAPNRLSDSADLPTVPVLTRKPPLSVARLSTCTQSSIAFHKGQGAPVEEKRENPTFFGL